jgi:hypothetical protein
LRRMVTVPSQQMGTGRGRHVEGNRTRSSTLSRLELGLCQRDKLPNSYGPCFHVEWWWCNSSYFKWWWWGPKDTVYVKWFKYCVLDFCCCDRCLKGKV